MKKRILIALVILSLFFTSVQNLEAKIINTTSLKIDSEVLFPTINKSIEILSLPPPKGRNFDVIIIGGTPSGIVAAIAAARYGMNTAIIERWGHVGGMMTNGLSRTDIVPRTKIIIKNSNRGWSVDGIFRELIDNIYDYYVNTYGRLSSQVDVSTCGLYFEPHVAELVFHKMILDEGERIQVFCFHQLIEVEKQGNNISSILVLDRMEEEKFRLYGKLFIDATYEGDLAAMAGCSYRVGREGRDEYNETYAGTIYLKPTETLIPNKGWLDHYFLYRFGITTRPQLCPIEEIPEEQRDELGKGDHRIMAYNFRFILTDNPAIRVPVEKPKNYNSSEFLPLVKEIEEGKITSLSQVIRFLSRPIPNSKYCANAGRCWMSIDLAEENYDYPEANWSIREKIIQRYYDYTVGMLYFLQHNLSLPEAFRQDALKYGFACDEFTDNNYFPEQLYIREARRIIGEYVFREQDALPVPGKIRPPIFGDSIACGDYLLDSHICRKPDIKESHITEGNIYVPTSPYMIPYRAILPKEVDNLLVSVACSATHVGFSTLRMEPVLMALGQAAGTAAYRAIDIGCEPRKVDINILQDTLLNDRQIICYFVNLPENPQMSAIMQKMGVKGFCPFYNFLPVFKIRFLNAN